MVAVVPDWLILVVVTSRLAPLNQEVVTLIDDWVIWAMVMSRWGLIVEVSRMFSSIVGLVILT